MVERGGRERDEAVVSALAATYIVPINRISVRLSLSPVGIHGTIPAEMRNRKQQLFPLGRSDEVGHPATGSKWYYINLWVMCWPTDHSKKPLTG